jgi:MtN3 and saliva related transmembrane protein
MDYIEALGLLAAFFTTIANIPQTIKVIRTRDVKSLSSVTYAMLFLGMLLWVAYGVVRSDLPIILANAIAGALCGTILVMKLICSKETKTATKE